MAINNHIDRTAVANSFRTVLNRIREAKVKALKVGYNPTEVFLGPKENRIIVAELNWQSIESGGVPQEDRLRLLIKGSAAGGSIMGMAVRLTVEDGVRVGISFEG